MLLCICFSSIAYGQQNEKQISAVNFVENKGQWHENIVFESTIPDGKLYLEKAGLTFSFLKREDVDLVHDLHHGYKLQEDPEVVINGHAYHVSFVNGNANPTITSANQNDDIVNYYSGNDPSKWATGARRFGMIVYKDVWPNIDFSIYGMGHQLKYEFVVHPNGDPNAIQLQYEGVSSLTLENKKLKVTTSVNQIFEDQPFVYQQKNRRQKEIKSAYVLNGKTLSFQLEKYDNTEPVIIDPTLIFATYSGSTSDNWGYTATFDESGHLYAGGVVFGTGYPLTVGAFQTVFNGGNTGPIVQINTDIVITKYSSDGATLNYSTYLGGTSNESPHSLIVNHADELLVFGTTSSADYPTTPTAYNVSFQGGTATSVNYANYTNGSDIIVTKFSSTGALAASTFIGGSKNDGLIQDSDLTYNYADGFRGEIIVDANDNCLIATSTSSTDFPIISGAQSTYGGGSADGLVFKLNTNLSSLLWSTFLGGVSGDCALSIVEDSQGSVFVTGGTKSSDFPTTSSTIEPVFQGGVVDGYLAKLGNGGGSIDAATFIGTTAFDQSYFVQVDSDDKVYVVGQTEGNYPITPSTVYNNAPSGQFLHKLENDLSSTLLSTELGTGNGGVDISITAFLVNDCDQIYISGWGGTSNSAHGGPVTSTTNGLPITSNAYQGNTDGSDFYLMILDPTVTSLEYATFFGGSSSNEHVDGGTSRFDADGIVYQAVCAGCGGLSDFPTTPGAWSNTNNSTNCNIAAIKFDLSVMTAIAAVNEPFICWPDAVQFTNSSNGGITYFWDFGDGNTSTDFEPNHTYADTGIYEVMLIVGNPLSCVGTDTSFVSIEVIMPPELDYVPIPPVCPGSTVSLEASGATSYFWTPSLLVASPTSAITTGVVDTTTVFNILGSSFCGSLNEDITVLVFEDYTLIPEDTMLCIGESILLELTGAYNPVWTPAASLDDANSATPIASPTTTTTYTIQYNDSNGCPRDTIIIIYVDNELPTAVIGNDTTICLGDSAQLSGGGGWELLWSPANEMADNSLSQPTIRPLENTIYTLHVYNGCGVDSAEVTILVSTILPEAVPDTAACLGDELALFVSGGETYEWKPSYNLDNANIPNPIATVTGPLEYYVQIWDSVNCTATVKIHVDTLPGAQVDAGVDLLLEWGKEDQLSPTGSGPTWQWQNNEGIDCLSCENPIVNPSETTWYYLTMTDQNGCSASDSVQVFVSGVLWVPNTFTPNDNRLNDIFYAYGNEIIKFEMWIYDRWGELIFNSTSIKRGWDGTYHSKLCQIGTYIWKVEYTETSGKTGSKIGHVNLVR